MYKKIKRTLLVLSALLLLLALPACSDPQKAEAGSPQSIPGQFLDTVVAESVAAPKVYPFAQIGVGESEQLSAQAAANLGGALALELCGMDLSEGTVELTYDPEYDSAFFSDETIPNYKGSIKTENEYLNYTIDAQTGVLYAIDHGPYDEATGIGSAEHALTIGERQEALQKLTAFLERQGEEFTLQHTQWGKFYVTFHDGGGLYVWYDKYPNGVFVSEMKVAPSTDAPYPKTAPDLEFLEDSYPLKGVSGLDEQGTWSLTPREAYQTAANGANAICGMDFDKMEAYAFGNGRNPERPEFYGTCIFSDGAATPEHLVYASDIVSEGYYEATWSVDAMTGQLLHLNVAQAHIGFPSVDFKNIAVQKANDILDALGIQGKFTVVEIGECTITVTDPNASGHTYELLFYDTEGYAFSGLYYC